MGIRCQCPNGHPLHVKSFLAGKRGICPRCGSKFVIPVPLPATMEEVEAVAEAEEEDEFASLLEAFADPLPELQAQENAGKREASVPPADFPEVDELPAALEAEVEEAEIPQLALDEGPPPPPPVRGPARWYVRAPGGEQYGPAEETAFTAWLAEGRISADSLLWREDWTSWRNAGELYPQLRTQAVAALEPAPREKNNASAAKTAPADSQPRLEVPSPQLGSARRRPYSRSKRGTPVWLVVTLALAAIVLLVAFVLVLLYSGDRTRSGRLTPRTPPISLVAHRKGNSLSTSGFPTDLS